MNRSTPLGKLIEQKTYVIPYASKDEMPQETLLYSNTERRRFLGFIVLLTKKMKKRVEEVHHDGSK